MQTPALPDIPERAADILVVDDDPAIVRLLTRVLERDGYRVRSTDNGSNALHMIIQECPDVLMTDWMMPGVDGLELCRRIRRLHQRKVLPHYVYVLMLTAQTGREHFVEALDAGADDFILKGTADVADLKLEIQARLRAGLRPRRLERALERAAKYDALTQLLNRATFFEQGAYLWERATRNKFPISCVMLDCDYFKRINDVHGHQAGDSVLAGCAEILRQHTRAHDLVGRYGGEEFAILLPNCREKTAWNLAERIRLYLEKTPIVHNNTLPISATASFGVVERTEEIATIEKLFERADAYLRLAKESGRNCCIGTADAVVTAVPGRQRITSVLGDATVRDVMEPLQHIVHAGDTVAATVERMLQHNVEMVPVIGDEWKFIGVVTSVSLLSLIGVLPKWHGTVDEHIVPNSVSYQADASVRVVFDFFSRTTLPCVWVLEDQVPVGLVTCNGLLRWLRDHWNAIAPQRK